MTGSVGKMQCIHLLRDSFIILENDVKLTLHLLFGPVYQLHFHAQMNLKLDWKQRYSRSSCWPPRAVGKVAGTSLF